MPNIKSAIKRVRQTEKRTARNRVRKERLKQTLKSFNRAIEAGDGAQAQELFKKATNLVDKAGNKGILHKNAVSRKKSQLALKLNSISA